MYRHQQNTTTTASQFHPASAAAWYPAHTYHPQAGQLAGGPPATYCMQDDQMWHHHHPAHTQPMFHAEYHDFMGMQQPHHMLEQDQLPSPPITVSGSDMSSPGGGGGNVSPLQTQNRPVPVRSPFEWIKKTNYQSQPNPGKTRTKDKYRVVYTDHQRVELEKEFYYSRYITIRRKAELATNLGLSERQVKIWFQNRRAKERKQVKKREELNHKDSGQAVTYHLQQQTQQPMLHEQNQQMGRNVVPVPVPLI